MIYKEIYNFCAVRNKGSIFKNETGCFTPRVKWILDLLEKEGLDFEVDIFTIKDMLSGFNIILRGTSNKWVTAHHDIVNPDSDNANDNSCSIINAIALKKLVPEVNIAIIDGEEFGGLGAQRLSLNMKAGHYGVVDWILNLELTGLGGLDFLVGAAGFKNTLGQKIDSMFEFDIVNVPFNDSVIFRQNGFDSIVINPLPRLENGELDTQILYRCHSIEDSVDKISPEDMKIFTEEVLVPIVKE